MMTVEDIIMICENALVPYEGGKEAIEKIKRALERSTGHWIEYTRIIAQNHIIDGNRLGSVQNAVMVVRIVKMVAHGLNGNIVLIAA